MILSSCVQALAMAQFERYKILKASNDLDQSKCPSRFHGIPRCRTNIQMFFHLTAALIHRAEDSRWPEDVTRCIVHLRYLRGQSLKVFNILPIRVTGLLLDALEILVEMRLGDVRQDIEEMTVLCRELIKSDIPTTFLTGFITGFVRAVNAQFG